MRGGDIPSLSQEGKKMPHSQRWLIFVCQPLLSQQANSGDAGYIAGTPSHPCFQNGTGSLGDRKIFPKCENDDVQVSPQTSATQVSMHWLQAGIGEQQSREVFLDFSTRAVLTGFSGSQGLENEHILQVWLSGTCWVSLSGRVLGMVILCEPCLQLEWEAAPGLCKQKIQKEKNPHVSSCHSLSLRFLELLLTPSPAWEKVLRDFLLSLECASPRRLSRCLCSSTNVLIPWLCVTLPSDTLDVLSWPVLHCWIAITFPHSWRVTQVELSLGNRAVLPSLRGGNLIKFLGYRLKETLSFMLIHFQSLFSNLSFFLFLIRQHIHWWHHYWFVSIKPCQDSTPNSFSYYWTL